MRVLHQQKHAPKHPVFAEFQEGLVGLLQKRKKKVIIPIPSELLAVLEMEYTRRSPDPNERALLHPVRQTPLTRPHLYERMRGLGKRAGVSDVHSHRFRDTFAVDMLAGGASPYEEAKLLGDTIETVEKHYAEFVGELREKVRRMMESKEGGLEAFSEVIEPNKPRAKTGVM